MKPLKDYSFVRGFNYTQSNVWTDVNFWEEYDHGIVERDLGYAERLRLNSARIFLTYSSYIKNPQQFLSNVKDFVRTAWKHGISTNPIIYHGMRFLPEDLGERHAGEPLSFPKTLEDKSCWVLGEKYFDDLYDAIGNEPGLLFWDISNEPGFRVGNATWYEQEPEYARAWEDTPDLEAVRARQELIWEVTNPHFKWGFDFNPSGVVPGFRQRRDFADLFYWLPSKEGISTFFRPLTCHFLPVLECTLVLSLRSHCLPSKHNNLLPRNACLPICFDILDVCRKASVYSFLSDMT